MKRMISAVTIVAVAALSFFTFGGATPIPLGKAANSARIDGVAADGQGGWLDTGPHDLHVLPAGDQNFGGVDFRLEADRDENSRTCIVLGRNGRKDSAKLTIPAGSKGGMLYLLHATADSAALKKTPIGVVRMEYAEGPTHENVIIANQDVADWLSGRSLGHAVRVWSQYNDNTQVSLFCTEIDINPSNELRSVTFEAWGKCPWMIVGVSRGMGCRIRGIKAPTYPTHTVKLPPAPSETYAMTPPGQKPKNVILIIGDGMGESSIDFTSLYCLGREKAMLMNRLPIQGKCTTVSVQGKTTDSAAAATAIATGTKTMNGLVGVEAKSDEERKSAKRLTPFTERLHAQGTAVGLLTSDIIAGATPAGFYAHARSRSERDKMTAQAAECGYELLVSHSNTQKNLKGTDLAAHGYLVVTNREDFAAAERGRKIFGMFGFGEGEDNHAKAVTLALDKLSFYEQGFFLMAESVTPDHGNHSNIPDMTLQAAAEVDWMTKAAMDFAVPRGDTLVIVTADHDTGGIDISRDAKGKPQLTYTSTSHTTRPVALFAYGPGAERFAGEIDNTDIAKIISTLML